MSAAVTGGSDRARATRGATEVGRGGFGALIAGGKASKRSDGTSFAKLFVRECKSTVNLTMRVERAWFERVRLESVRTGRLPLVVLGFAGGGQKDELWGCVPLDLLARVVRGWLESEHRERTRGSRGAKG